MNEDGRHDGPGRDGRGRGSGGGGQGSGGGHGRGRGRGHHHHDHEHGSGEHGSGEHGHGEHERSGEHGHGEHGHRREPPLPEGLAETEGRPGGDYVYVRDRLLVDAAAADEVRQALEQAGAKVVEAETSEEIGVVAFSMAPGSPAVPDLVDRLAAGGDPTLRPLPDHVLARSSHVRFIPATTPRAARELPDGRGSGLGQGVVVGVLDTGAWEHPWFGGRCQAGSGHLDDGDADGDGLLDFVAGHGTFIAGVILQHLPGATVLARRIPAARTVPDQGTTTDSSLAAALLANRDLAGATVLSLSVGGYTHDGRGLLSTTRALRRYTDANPSLVVVAGAGNDATDQPFFPAADKTVLAVGAIDAAGQRACFSNHGWWVDVCALGVDVHSTFLEWDGPLAPMPEPAAGCGGKLPAPSRRQAYPGWAYWDGTSFAAPLVAAVLGARIAAGVPPAEAVAELRRGSGRRVPGLGAVVEPPRG